MSTAAPHPDFVLAKIQPPRPRFGLIERPALEAALSRALLPLTLRETERRLRGAKSISTSDRSGSAAPVRDHEMQPFAFEFVQVGICYP